MGEKYFTISYDDGLEQDKRIIELMGKYGIKGTFNISSGLFGEKTYIKRIGNLGYAAGSSMKRASKYYSNHFILTLDEAKKLYSNPNVEVASHGTHHVMQNKLTLEEAQEEIAADVAKLSELFGYQVVGHALPFGSYNDNVLSVLKEHGVKYARKVSAYKKPKDFTFDKNNILLTPTCWQLDRFTESLLQQFIEEPAEKKDQLFYMWGHGYELDFGTSRGNWDYLEHLFEMVSRAKDVHCVKNKDIFDSSACTMSIF